MRTLAKAALAATLFLAAASSAQAQTNFSFGGTSFSCLNNLTNCPQVTQGPFGDTELRPIIWNDGDYMRQAGIVDPNQVGPTRVTRLTLNLAYESTFITGAPVFFDVFLNGNNVGFFRIPGSPSQFAFVNQTFDFNPIYGTSYDVKLQISSGGAEPGEGAMAMFTTDYAPYEIVSGGSLDISAVPEPASMALMATGLIGVGIVGRRRRKV